MATPARAEAAAILPELLINSRREVRLVGLWFIGYIFSTQTSGCQFEKSGPAHQSHQWLRSRSRLTTGDTADYQSALRGSADCQSAVSRTGSPHEPALCQWPFGPRTTDDTTTLPLVDSLSPRRRSGERVREKGFQLAAPIRMEGAPLPSPLPARASQGEGAGGFHDGGGIEKRPTRKRREIRARRSLHPPQFCYGGRVAPPRFLTV